jgi:hypothetical protein
MDEPKTKFSDIEKLVNRELPFHKIHKAILMGTIARNLYFGINIFRYIS